jgi:hypothetical protein
MKKIQFIVFVSALVISAVYFIYTLSFSTGWALGEDFFQDFYREAQVANKDMYAWSLRTLVASGIMLLLNTHKNRKFYIMNFVAVIIVVFLFIYSAIITLNYIPHIQALYLELPEAFLRIIVAINYSSISTDIFDLGIFLAYIMLLQAVLMIICTILKTLEQIERDRQIKELNSGAYK